MSKQKKHGPPCACCKRDEEHVRTFRALDLYEETGQVFYICPKCESVFCAQRMFLVRGKLCRRLKSMKVISLFMDPIRFLRETVIEYLPEAHKARALKKLEEFSPAL